MNEHPFTSEIHLDQNALEKNIAFLRAEMGKDVVIASVVKGNAYGHGIEAFVPMAERCGVNHFAVFSGEEALRVRRCAQTESSIIIMGYLTDAQLDWAIEEGIEFFVSDSGRLHRALELARNKGIPCRIHIELETGMNRTGFSEDELEKAVYPLLQSDRRHYRLAGLCTHFAGAEHIANYFRIQAQKEQFLYLKCRFEELGFFAEKVHTCCSAAALRLPEMRFDMVRIGILQYGYWPSQESKIEYLLQKDRRFFNLSRILSWKSRLMSINRVEKGAFIGYGDAFKADEAMRVGIIPVGYANGYSRMLSNSGTVLVEGRRVFVLGNVNMNSLIVDLRNVPDARVGSVAVLIGQDGENEISVASFGELSNQLNYELLTRLPSEIPRIVTGAYSV